MNNNWLAIGALVFVLFIGGMIWLGSNSETAQSSSANTFLSYAEAIGLDGEKFATDVDSAEVKSSVQEDRTEGGQKRVQSTPTFLINGAQINMQVPNAFEEALVAAITAAEVQTVPENVHIKGAENPTVLIEEFSDFQCPACKNALGIIKQTLEANPDTVALIYKNFPLVQIHPYAKDAAEAAEAAALQGKFWEMHDMLFDKQDEWSR